MTDTLQRPAIELKANCDECAALCCAAYPFVKSEEFAEDKPAETPCRHLDGDQSCKIYEDRATAGYRGCLQFDCYGAGQRTLKDLFKTDKASLSVDDMPDIYDVFRRLTKAHSAYAQLRLFDGLPLNDRQMSDYQKLHQLIEPDEGWTKDTIRAAPVDGLEAKVHAFAQTLIGTKAGDELITRRLPGRTRRQT